MARLSFQENLSRWKGKPYKYNAPLTLAEKPSESTPERAKGKAGMAGIIMGNAVTEGGDIRTVLYLNDTQPSPLQIGRAARYLLAQAGPEILSVTLTPSRGNVRGRSITLSRRDLEQAMVRRQGSPEEIWQDIRFGNVHANGSAAMPRKYKIFPEVELSFGEEDTSHFHRVSIVAEEGKHYGYGFYAANALRLNLND